MKLPAIYESIAEFNALETLLKQRHLKDIQNAVDSSVERVFSISFYANKKNLIDVKTLAGYEPNAFDEGTIQDLKYHEKANEIYFVLKGSVKILWKSKNSARFEHVLILSDSTSRYAEIPAGYCLLVSPHNDNRFLAIALKTEKSNIEDGKGKKKLGKYCQYYKKKLCSTRNQCEKLRLNRSNFLRGLMSRQKSLINQVKLRRHIMIPYSRPFKKMEDIINEKRKEGLKDFKKFVEENNLSKNTKVTSRPYQQIAKVQINNLRPYFDQYRGLTWAIPVPRDTQHLLSEKRKSLNKYLKDIGLADKFLHVPSDTFHFTLTGICERKNPEIVQEEIAYYYYLSTRGMSCFEMEEIPFVLNIKKFSMFKNLVIFVEVVPQCSPVRLLKRLKMNLGQSIRKVGSFHITLAYFVEELDKKGLKELGTCLERASELLLKGNLSFSANEVWMYYFAAMDKYQKIPGTRLPFD